VSKNKDRVSINVLASHGATVAEATYASPCTGPVSASGEAKREPGDEYDRETGRLLATARALEVLARKLRRRANGRIRNAEAIKVHRQRVAGLDSAERMTLSDPEVRRAAAKATRYLTSYMKGKLEKSRSS